MRAHGQNFRRGFCAWLRHYRTKSTTTILPVTQALCKWIHMILKIKIAIKIALITLISCTSFAENVDANKKKQQSFLSIESIIIMSSLIASQYPEEYGVGTTLISPFVLAGDEHDSIRYTGFGGMASIGLYNALELKKDKYSKSEVFKRNMIIFHVVFGSLHLLEKKYGEFSSSLSLSPVSDGLTIGYHHEF